MRKSQYTEEQIAFAPRQAEQGMPVAIVDSGTREYHAIEVGKNITGERVAKGLEDIRLTRDLPETIFLITVPSSCQRI